MSKYITVNPHASWAGIGHQWSNWLVPYMLAKKYNLKFIHQPFRGETDGTYCPYGSNGGQITAPVKEWNEFLNFGKGELTLENVQQKRDYDFIRDLPYIDQEEAVWNHPIWERELNDELFTKRTIYQVSESDQGQFVNIDWEFFFNNDLKHKYNNSQKVKEMSCYFNDYFINIAIQIRRGDVTKDQQFRRWKDLDYYENVIRSLAEFSKNIAKPFKYNIYSWQMPTDEQKRLMDLAYKLNINMELHVDENVFSTFYHLTKADIYVNGQSTFSVLAAYLSNGIKLCTPFAEHWHSFPTDKKDIIEIKDCTFDKERLLNALV